jgi:hypothetical protein
MNSGGGRKEDFSLLFIEAPEAEAKVIFFNRFGHNPERVTCTCCGDDYSIDEEETLEQASASDRGCRYDAALDRYVEEPDPERRWGGVYIPLPEFISAGDRINGAFRNEKVAFIFAADIKPEERAGNAPQQGYVWL